MPETQLAEAIKAAVSDWMQSTEEVDQLAEIQLPATLSIKLGLLVQLHLTKMGISSQLVREHILKAPFFLLKDVFDATTSEATPIDFQPIPDVSATIGGRAAALAAHAVLQLETISYGSENDGSLFVNLVPMPGTGQFAEKSKKDMRGHTDGVSFPFNGDDDPENPRIAPSPDVVTLIGIRNPDNIATKVIKLEDVLAKLSKEEIDELKKSQFSINSQGTFIQGMKRILGQTLVVIAGPILKDAADGTHIRYSHEKVVPTDENGPGALVSAKLEDICEEVGVLVMVNPGDVCLISNRLCLHGRQRVGEDVGGQARWLMRTYALDSKNLEQHKRSNGHILFP